MNTKTMRLPPRRVSMASTPGGPTTNKRKEREDSFDGPKPSTPTVTTTTKLLKPDKLRTGLEPPTGFKGLEPPSGVKGSEPSQPNELLAGYLAHEFLTSGTLFGQPWDPSLGEGPASNSSVPMEKRKGKASEKREGEVASGSGRAEQTESEKYARYVEVASLLKKDGAQLPGIVNPTQLARYLQM